MVKKYKTKKRARHHKGTRHDYRQGGRVAFQRGGPRENEPRETTKEPGERDIDVRDDQGTGSISQSEEVINEENSNKND